MTDDHSYRATVRALLPGPVVRPPGRSGSGPVETGAVDTGAVDTGAVDTGAVDTVAGWLHRVCTAAVQMLPADGIGVSLMTQTGVLGPAAASDQISEALGQVQFSLGEGPCVEAFSSHRAVLVPDLSTSTGARWPGYCAEALALGVRSVFCFPLQVGAARLGTLDLHRRRPGPLSDRSTGLALAFADVTIEGLLDFADGAGQTTGPAADPAEPAELPAPSEVPDLLDSHLVVYQAQGMTMIDLRVSLVDALARLRAHAFATNRSLHDVSRDIVEGRLRLEPDST